VSSAIASTLVGIKSTSTITAGAAAGAVGRELAASQRSVLDVLNGQRTADGASLIVPGVAGPLSIREPGWSTSFQSDLFGFGLTNEAPIEFTWSGFDLTGAGVLPDPTIHGIATKSLNMSLTAAHAKGYSEVNIAAHSWGTTISFDTLNENIFGAADWVTFGSPLKGSTPRPSGVSGLWADFFSDSDPTPSLAAFPPFNAIPNNLYLPTLTVRGSTHVKASADIGRPVHEMVVPFGGPVWAGAMYEHTAYWGEPEMLNWMGEHL
jgi:hypothetical protein